LIHRKVTGGSSGLALHNSVRHHVIDLETPPGVIDQLPVAWTPRRMWVKIHRPDNVGRSVSEILVTNLFIDARRKGAGFDPGQHGKRRAF